MKVPHQSGPVLHEIDVGVPRLDWRQLSQLRHRRQAGSVLLAVVERCARELVVGGGVGVSGGGGQAQRAPDAAADSPDHQELELGHRIRAVWDRDAQLAELLSEHGPLRLLFLGKDLFVAVAVRHEAVRAGHGFLRRTEEVGHDRAVRELLDPICEGLGERVLRRDLQREERGILARVPAVGEQVACGTVHRIHILVGPRERHDVGPKHRLCL
mmetsp:Transcript_4626/g.9933  ORF Transcript_4626/g.9933 Transcript_4626/m.9933 type:complete len:213 (-) Transcript_4626:1447-2085(-)